jgi:hypothetical protein
MLHAFGKNVVGTLSDADTIDHVIIAALAWNRISSVLSQKLESTQKPDNHTLKMKELERSSAT